jgi:4-aminobutyrate aminotransferase-like enzyme
MTAIELSTDQLADSFVGELFQRKVLVIHTVNSHTTVRVCPPLVITSGQVDQALEAMDSALRSL